MASSIPGIEDAREILKKHKIVIAGIGETEQGKIPNKSSFQFLSEASQLGIEGGGTAVWMVAEDAMAIAAGQAEVVLCVRGDNTLSGISSSGMVALIREMCHAEFEFPYGLTTPGGYALAAQRYFHEYNARQEHLAAVAVTMRKHASLKPNAMNKEPLTIDEVVNSRIFIAFGLRLACFLIVTATAARCSCLALYSWKYL